MLVWHDVGVNEIKKFCKYFMELVGNWFYTFALILCYSCICWNPIHSYFLFDLETSRVFVKLVLWIHMYNIFSNNQKYLEPSIVTTNQISNLIQVLTNVEKINYKYIKFIRITSISKDGIDGNDLVARRRRWKSFEFIRYRFDYPARKRQHR